MFTQVEVFSHFDRKEDPINQFESNKTVIIFSDSSHEPHQILDKI